MHERNIYKTPANFAKLAKKYGFLAPFVTLDAKGLAKINFKDSQALRALTRALLLQDFRLDVEIPEGVLVPTVPLRLNYILWVEDLLAGADPGNKVDPVRGIDIGTGATAIYALLGARKNKWRMTGTEVEPSYVEIARRNVERNMLEDLVEIVASDKNSPILSLLEHSHDLQFSFTMCNPPFFGSDEETDSVSKGRFSPKGEALRPSPSAVKTGTSTELVAEGGELLFVQSIIKESAKFPKKVLIYTTMIGVKRHLKPLINFLHSLQISNYTTTEFVQGKTMRWGLAWSFLVNLLPPKPDLVWTFSDFSPLINFESLIASYLEELKLHSLNWISSEEKPVVEVVATENTWSNQRRKRRMEKRMEVEVTDLGRPDDIESSPQKVPKTFMDCDNTSSSSKSTPSTTTSTSCYSTGEDKPVLLHCFIDLLRDEDGTNATLLLRYREGTLGKEGLHQILQYIKNRYQKDKADGSLKG